MPTLAQSFVQAMLQIGRDSGGLGVRNRFVISRCAARREDIAARSDTIVTLPVLLLTVFAERQIRSRRSQCGAIDGVGGTALLFERSYKTAQSALRTAGSARVGHAAHIASARPHFDMSDTVHMVLFCGLRQAGDVQ